MGERSTKPEWSFSIKNTKKEAWRSHGRNQGTSSSGQNFVSGGINRSTRQSDHSSFPDLLRKGAKRERVDRDQKLRQKRRGVTMTAIIAKANKQWTKGFKHAKMDQDPNPSGSWNDAVDYMDGYRVGKKEKERAFLEFLTFSIPKE
jgi:hypothetical protein